MTQQKQTYLTEFSEKAAKLDKLPTDWKTDFAKKFFIYDLEAKFLSGAKEKAILFIESLLRQREEAIVEEMREKLTAEKIVLPAHTDIIRFADAMSVLDDLKSKLTP